MATLTRGTTVLTPALVEPIALTRPGRTVVHQVLGSPAADLTIRPAGPRTGQVVTVWATRAAADTAAAALAAAGGTWTIADDSGTTLLAQVTGDLAPAPGQSGGHAWTLTLTVTEVTA